MIIHASWPEHHPRKTKAGEFLHHDFTFQFSYHDVWTKVQNSLFNSLLFSFLLLGVLLDREAEEIPSFLSKHQLYFSASVQ